MDEKAKIRLRATARKRQEEAEKLAVFSQQGEGLESLTGERPDVSDVDPFALSEAGLEVGSQKGRTASVRNVAQGLTFGGADEIEAGVASLFSDAKYSEELDAIRNEMKQYTESKGDDALAQELAGALMSPASLLKAPKYIQQMAPLVQGAIKGLGSGFTYGFLGSEGDVVDRAQEGAIAGTVGLMVGAPLEKLASSVSTRLANRAKAYNTSPTIDSLKQLRDDAYAAVDSKQVFMGLDDMDTLVQRASKVVADKDYVSLDGAPTVVDRVKKILEGKQGQALTLGQTDKLRQNLFKYVDNKEYGTFVRDIIDELDDMVDSKLSAAGDDTLRLAREAHQSYGKARTLQEAFDAADNKVSDNSLQTYRQGVSSILNNPRKIKYFNERDKELMKKFVDGSLPQNALRFIGKFSPTSSGFMLALHTTSGYANPWMLLATVASAGSKFTNDKMIISKAKKLVDSVGGIQKVRQQAELPLSQTLGGFTGNQIRAEFLGPEEE